MSFLFDQRDWVKQCGAVLRTAQFLLGDSRKVQDASQLHTQDPGIDEPGKPTQKVQIWLSNFDLEPMELRKAAGPGMRNQ